MKKVRLNFFIVLIFAILIASFASATFEVNNYSIEKTYNLSESLIGWVEINFTEQPNETLFEDSEQNSVLLQGLLTINPGFNYEISSDGKVNSTGIQKLYFDNGPFSLPVTEGKINYSMNFGGQEIFKEEIEIIDMASSSGVNETLNQKLSDVQSIKTQISQYDLFSRESLTKVLELDSIEQELQSLKLSYEKLNVSEEEILANVSKINIPETILRTIQSSEPIPIIPKKSYVDLEKIKEIAGGDYDSERRDEYENAVLGWIINNAEVKISLNGFSEISNGSTKAIMTVFNLHIDRKSDTTNTFYIFINNQEDFEFKEEYGEINGSYYIIEISGNQEVVSFYTEKEIDFEGLDFFVAPSLNQLVSEDFEVEPFEESSGFKWVIFVLVIILLLIIGVVIYVVLQVWYKKKYEAYLFKNKNDLYNLANYIHLSKKKGMDNDQIIKNLKKAKWNSEQIRYAVRKYSGRRTGMFEIPLGKLLEKEEKSFQDKRRFGNR